MSVTLTTTLLHSMPRSIAERSQMVKETMRSLGEARVAPLPSEKIWMALFDQLDRRGYLLRPRYRKDWKPSWMLEENKDMDPLSFEDALEPAVCSSSSHFCFF